MLTLNSSVNISRVAFSMFWGLTVTILLLKILGLCILHMGLFATPLIFYIVRLYCQAVLSGCTVRSVVPKYFSASSVTMVSAVCSHWSYGGYHH